MEDLVTRVCPTPANSDQCPRPLRVGLALGSGSARGWAHIGVIRALREAGVTIDCVAGASIGAVVGAVFASGTIDAFEREVLQIDWKRIVTFLDVSFSTSGLIDGNKVAKFIRRHIGPDTIEELPLPFRAVATDLGTGRELVIGTGSLIDAVRASSSVPGLFKPVITGNTTMVDGGLVNPVPVRVVRKMGADFVIAVDLNHDIVSSRTRNHPPTGDAGTPESVSVFRQGPGRAKMVLTKGAGLLGLEGLSERDPLPSETSRPGIIEVLLTSIGIMESQITESNLRIDSPDLLIQPKLGHMRFMEFNRAGEAIAEGYEAAKTGLGELGNLGGPLVDS